MRDLQEAIEVGCRAIESFMKDRGEQMSFHVGEVNLTRDVNHAPTDFAGNHYNVGNGATRISASLVGVHLGPIDKRKNEERMALKAKLTKSGIPGIPEVVADISDAGYRAGARALLEKFQSAIQNATQIAEGGNATPEFTRMLDQATVIRPNDIAAKLVKSVLDLREEVRAAEGVAEQARKELAGNPEKQLQERLKLKMKANYLQMEDVLREFQKFMLDHYSAHFPDARPDAVQDFLEQVGDD